MQQTAAEKGTGRLNGYLTPLSVFALALGCSVGWGSFVMPGTTFLPKAGPLGSVAGLAIGALVMLVVGVNYHYLMQRYTDAGGAYSFATKICGHDHGFLCAWFLALTYLAVLWANASAFCLIGRNLLNGLFKVGWHYSVAGYEVYMGEIAVTLGALGALALLCFGGRRLAIRLNTVLAFVLCAGIAAGLFAVLRGGEASADAFKPLFAGGAGRAAQILGIVVLAPWAYVGFESISHSAEEFRFPKRWTIWIIVAALAAGAACYIALTVIAASIQPEGCRNWSEYIARLGEYGDVRGLPAFYAVESAMGRKGVVILCFATFAAIVTGLVGNLIACSRLFYAMSRDRILPPWFGEIAKDGSPRNAMLFIVAVSAFVPFVGRTAIGWIVDVTTIGACVVYAYVSFCALRQARRERNRAVMACGAAGLAVSTVFTVYFMVPNLWSLSAFAPESYLVFAAWSIVGTVFFRKIVTGDKARRFGGSTVAWLSLLFLIFFSSHMWVRQATHRVTANVVADFGEYCEASLGEAKAEAIGVDKFVADHMDMVKDSLTRYSFAQMTLVIIALAIMFNIYWHLLRREKWADAERIRAHASNKAKSVFLSSMSHDIRTPMNAIVGYTALALREGTEAGEMRAYLRKIGTASDHLLALINDILEMSRIESGRTELELAPADLGALLAGIRDMFAPQTSSKGIDLELDISRLNRRHVLCDRNRFDRILINLVGNACKFTPAGGTISISAAELDGAEPGRGLYEIKVKDTGIGMSESFAAHVFDAFSRERSSTVSGIEGTGLGMAIVKNLVELMGGTIDVESAPGKGTAFTIKASFSLAEEPAAEMPRDAPGEAAGPNFEGMKLLLVDDNEINREIATAILEDAGFEVDVAENGRIAFEKVRDGGSGRYGAVVMDVQMPVMNGYEATRAIRALGIPGVSDVPIIALSANAFESDVKDALEAGMDAHVAKPVKIPDLMAKLSAVMSRRTDGAPGQGGGTGKGKTV